MEPSLKFNNGKVVPMFGLGTWLSEPGEVTKAVSAALKDGYKHIDCASGYGNQSEVGIAMTEYVKSGAGKREDIFITSKLWTKDFGYVKEACQKTLNELKLEYLDLYLIHLPFELDHDLPTGIPDETGVGLIGYNEDRINEVWKSMEALVEAGMVKSIGVSNFTILKLQNLLKSSPKIKPATNQVEMHPYLPQSRLLEYCKQNDITITAYSPLGAPGRPDGMKANDELHLLSDEVVINVAKKNNATVGQVLFAWAIQRGTIVIPKSVNEKRIKENIGCLQVKLDDEDMAKLSGIEKRYRYIKQRWACPPGGDLASLWDGENLG